MGILSAIKYTLVVLDPAVIAYFVFCLLAVMTHLMGMNTRQTVDYALFYGPNGEKTTGPVLGGWTILRTHFACYEGREYNLRSPDNTLKAKAVCQRFSPRLVRLEFKLFIKDLPFGRYVIADNDTDYDYWDYTYRYCNFEEARKYRCNGTCRIYQNGPDPCKMPTKKDCDGQHGEQSDEHICGAKVDGYPSFCHGEADGGKKYSTQKDKTCRGNERDTPHVYYNQAVRHIFSFIKGTPGQRLSVTCPVDAEYSVNCSVSVNGTELPLYFGKDRCEGGLVFLVDEIFRFLTGAVVLYCKVWNLVFEAGIELIIALIKTQDIKYRCNVGAVNRGETDKLICSVLEIEKYPNFFFAFNISNGTHSVSIEEFVLKSGTYTLSLEIWIVVFGSILFFMPSFLSKIHFEREQTEKPGSDDTSVSPGAGGSTSTNTSGISDDKKWNTGYVILMGILIFVLGGGLVGLIVFVVHRFWWSKRRSHTENLEQLEAQSPEVQREEIYQLMKRHVTTKKVSTDVKKYLSGPPPSDFTKLANDLKRLVENLSMDYEGYMKTFNDEFEATESNTKNYVEIGKCRYNIGLLAYCLKSTQVKLKDSKLKAFQLHMNVIPDVVQNPIFLSQAPTKDTMFAHLMAWYEGKVGVFVVTASLMEKDKEMVTPWWHPDDGGTMITKEEFCGTGERIFTVKTIGIESIFVGTQYKLEITLDKETTKKEVYLIHLDKWVDNTAFKPLDLAFTTMKIFNLHVKQVAKELPGVSVHCSGGYQRSPAVVVSYVCMETYLGSGDMNPVGGMKYVRKCRMNVFSDKMPTVTMAMFKQMISIVEASDVLKKWIDAKTTLKEMRDEVMNSKADDPAMKQEVISKAATRAKDSKGYQYFGGESGKDTKSMMDKNEASGSGVTAVKKVSSSSQLSTKPSVTPPSPKRSRSLSQEKRKETPKAAAVAPKSPKTEKKDKK